MSRLLVCVLATCFAVQSLGAQSGKFDLKVESKLTEDDPKDKRYTKSPCKQHDFKMEAGKIYIIELSSEDFDSLVRLEDAGGTKVARNDDAGPKSSDARIVHKVDKSGTYKIVVTSWDGKRGNYQLTVRQGSEEDLAKAEPFHVLIGKPAPEIVGEFSINGETKKLSDLKGKVVLVDLWAVWCGPCIQTFPHLREWDSTYKKAGLEILGVTTYFENFAFDKEKGQLKPAGVLNKEKTGFDGKLSRTEENNMLKDFVGHHKLAHRILVTSQPDWKRVSEALQVQGIPHAALIDRKGNIRMVRVGASEENAEDLEDEIKKLVAEK